MRVRLLMICLAVLSVPAVDALAEDSAQWRGPNRNGIYAEKGLLQQWPASGPKLVWKASVLGSGFGAPAVAEGRVYAIGNKGDDEFVHVFDEKTGKQLWSVKIGTVGPNNTANDYHAPRSTPTVVSNLVYAITSNGELACLETDKGKVVWQKSFRKDFGGSPGTWAYAESPLVDGDVVVCSPGGNKSPMVALDRKTGKLVWGSAIPKAGAAAYSSIAVGEVGGVRQYIQFFSKSLVGVEAKTGRVLWTNNSTANTTANIPSPIFQDGYVFTAQGYNGKGGLVKLTASGDKVQATTVYAETKLKNQIGGHVIINGFAYGDAGSALVCIDLMTGKEKWRERSVAPASVCYADGRIYVRGHKRETALIEATPDGYREKGRFKQSPSGKGKGSSWAYPVVANGQLFLRDQELLLCYDIKAK